MIPITLFESSLEDVNKNVGTFIAACGYERRASCLAEAISSTVPRRIAVQFQEHQNTLYRKRNEQTFEQHGFKMSHCSSENPAALEALIEESLESPPPLGIAIDISSMTRTWHGAIIRRLIQSPRRQPIETFFIYVPSQFQPPSDEPFFNEVVAPIEGFASLMMPNMPMALVLGLGYDPDKALGLQELLDPKRTVLMVPKLPQADDFYPFVYRNNRELLEQTPSQWIFEYSIREPVATFSILESICEGLRRDFRLILASLGPKLFGVLCLLLAAKYRDLSVWRASSGIHSTPKDALPDLKRVTVIKTLWVPE